MLARVTRIGESIYRAYWSGSGTRSRHPLSHQVPQSDGSGMRQVNIYQVADSAISKMLFESLLRKNLAVLSARAYAYRHDRSMQDAEQYVKSEFRGKHRLFIAEYDFSKYFENIDHGYLLRVLHDRFLITKSERHAVSAFLRIGQNPSPAIGRSREPRDRRAFHRALRSPYSWRTQQHGARSCSRRARSRFRCATRTTR